MVFDRQDRQDMRDIQDRQDRQDRPDRNTSQSQLLVKACHVLCFKAAAATGMVTALG